MPFSVESDGCGAVECCCFCWKRTSYWHTGKDVAVCPSCAKEHKVSEIPTKRAWIEACLAKFPSLVRI